jgi:nucleoside-diphosphate-sugar epimerase
MLAEGLRAAMRYAGAIERGPARDGDVEASLLAPDKARDTFGWEAKVDLQTGLGGTAAWFTQQR